MTICESCKCNCNWGTCITRRPRSHHRVSPYHGVHKQNQIEMFSYHDKTSPSNGCDEYTMCSDLLRGCGKLQGLTLLWGAVFYFLTACLCACVCVCVCVCVRVCVCVWSSQAKQSTVIRQLFTYSLSSVFTCCKCGSTTTRSTNATVTDLQYPDSTATLGNEPLLQVMNQYSR